MLTALSIRQPWVELILTGRKTVEVRSWSTGYRGQLWLHAGKQLDKKVLKRFELENVDLVTGALVGRCELVDCIEFVPETWGSWREQHLNEGVLEKRLYAWVLRGAERVSPVPLKGRLGLMRVNSVSVGIQ